MFDAKAHEFEGFAGVRGDDIHRFSSVRVWRGAGLWVPGVGEHGRHRF
jgi:hypothetical protein